MTEKQLNEYSIFTLRELARRVGVKSPTSKKKNQLINEILEIEAGVRTPNETTKQGRPPKNFGYSFIDVMNPENSMFAGQSATNISFNQHIENFEHAETQDVCGYIEQVNAHTSFLWVKSDFEFSCYFVTANLVNQFGLRSGDFVNAVVGTGEERMMVKEILAINSCPINKFTGKRADYSSIQHIEPNRKMKFNNENVEIRFGENVYLYGTNNNENSEILIKLLDECNATKKIYLNLSIAEKNKYILNNTKNIEFMVAGVLEGTEKAKKLISLAAERAKRLLENGEDVVIAIDDVQSICAIDDGEHFAVKKLMTVTKEGGKKGSISIFAIMNESFQLKIFEKLADKRFKILEKQLISR